MRLAIRHQIVYRYEGGGSGVAMRVRLVPVDGATQSVTQWSVTIDGQPVSGFLTNSYGVPETAWRVANRATQTIVVAEGIVETCDTAGIVGKTDEAADPRLFLRMSGHAGASAAIEALASEAVSAEGTLATLHRLSAAVHGSFPHHSTEPARDTADTSLVRADDRGQAAAHLFVAATRLLGIPARYVAGYKFDDGENAAQAAGDLHGWAEAWVEGLGWVAFDASENRCPDDRYVRLSWGMDAYDCAPLRGVAMISGDVAMETELNVAQAAAAESSQAQQQ